jgi:hypothetical protein
MLLNATESVPTPTDYCVVTDQIDTEIVYKPA